MRYFKKLDYSVLLRIKPKKVKRRFWILAKSKKVKRTYQKPLSKNNLKKSIKMLKFIKLSKFKLPILYILKNKTIVVKSLRKILILYSFLHKISSVQRLSLSVHRSSKLKKLIYNKLTVRYQRQHCLTVSIKKKAILNNSLLEQQQYQNYQMLFYKSVVNKSISYESVNYFKKLKKISLFIKPNKQKLNSWKIKKFRQKKLNRIKNAWFWRLLKAKRKKNRYKRVKIKRFIHFKHLDIKINRVKTKLKIDKKITFIKKKIIRIQKKHLYRSKFLKQMSTLYKKQKQSVYKILMGLRSNSLFKTLFFAKKLKSHVRFFKLKRLKKRINYSNTLLKLRKSTHNMRLLKKNDKLLKYKQLFLLFLSNKKLKHSYVDTTLMGVNTNSVNKKRNILNYMFLNKHTVRSFYVDFYSQTKKVNNKSKNHTNKVNPKKSKIYYFNFWQKKIATYKKARIIHWSAYTHKTIKKRRYKNFLYKYLRKIKPKHSDYIYNYFIAKFNLSYIFWKNFMDLYKTFLKPITFKKQIFQIPVSSFFWYFLKYHQSKKIKIKKRIKKWIYIHKKIKQTFWMQQKKQIPPFFSKQVYSNSQVHNTIQFDYLTNYFCILKNTLRLTVLNKAIYSNKFIKLQDFRYKS